MNKLPTIIKNIESALCLGQFVHWRQRKEFFSELSLAKSTIDTLRSSGLANDAAHLYEIFLAGSFEKANEVDDSDGDFAFWIRDLLSDLVESLQEGEHPPDKIAAKIVGWIDKDEYGFTDYFDNELFKVGNIDTIAAMRKMLESRSLCKLDAVKGQNRFEVRKIVGGTVIKDLNWLQEFYLQQHDIPSYLQIAEAFGLEPENCEKIASVLEKQGDFADALAWAENGLKLMINGESRFRYSSGNSLPQLHRRLLKKLGRQREAFQAAWAEFEQHPSIHTYREIRDFVEPEEAHQWYEQARGLILKQDSNHMSCIFDFLGEHEEHSLLRDLIEKSPDDVLEKLFYTSLKQTASIIERHAPLAAAKLYKAEALEILGRAKAKAYHYALENLAKVKILYEANDQAREWEILAAMLRAKHKRKSSFIGEFNMIISGDGLRKEPTFMERIGKHLDRTKEVDDD